jgi:hypothetical protein
LAALRCQDVWEHVSDYLDDGVDAKLRAQMEEHFAGCSHCRAVRDGMGNVAALAGDPRALQLPEGFSQRLRSRLARLAPSARPPAVAPSFELGIAPGTVEPGSHLLYFWESDDDFERGVRFLYPGLDSRQHCIIFGHDEALEKVQQVLRTAGYDPEELIRRGALSVLRRHASADITLQEIGAVVKAAARAGSTAIRFLGNLGMGKDPLPGGEADVHELESRASAVIRGFPCVIVCMYDVRTLSGSIVVQAGLETHRLTVCSHGLRENPFYTGDEPPGHLRHIH